MSAETKTEDTWNERFNMMMKRIDGLAHMFVTEFQNFEHYVEEGEEALEEKFYEWHAHV